MYIEPYSSKAQRQFRKTVETFNKISQLYEASTFEIIGRNWSQYHAFESFYTNFQPNGEKFLSIS